MKRVKYSVTAEIWIGSTYEEDLGWTTVKAESPRAAVIKALRRFGIREVNPEKLDVIPHPGQFPYLQYFLPIEEVDGGVKTIVMEVYSLA